MTDGHIWLSPQNAMLILQAISQELSLKYPNHRQAFAENSQLAIDAINQKNQLIAKDMEKIKARPFIVFHDGYQYFEKSYDLAGVGSITLEPNESPSPNRIQQIKEKISKNQVQCIFAEPQFSPKLVKLLQEENKIKTEFLDPLGVKIDIHEGKQFYPKLMQSLSLALQSCLEK